MLKVPARQLKRLQDPDDLLHAIPNFGDIGRKVAAIANHADDGALDPAVGMRGIAQRLDPLNGVADLLAGSILLHHDNHVLSL